MKRSPFLLSLVVAASACSTTQGGPPLARELVYWPPGRYQIEASIRYRQVSGDRESPVTDMYHATLIVTPNGSLVLTTPAGSCEPSLASEARRNAPPGQRRFQCADVMYFLWPENERMGGEIVTLVQEKTLVRGRTLGTFSGDTLDRCIECVIDSRTTEKRARLRFLNES